MLEAYNDGTIKVSKNETLEIPLFLNCGTYEQPIRYKVAIGYGNEVYFHIIQPNNYFDSDTTVTKTFTDSDFEFNEFGDLIIKLTPEFLSKLPEGTYYYQVRAKLYDYELQKLMINTVTNKFPFILLSDVTL